MNKETLVTLNEWSKILNITIEGNSSPSTLVQLQKISFEVFYTPPTNYFYKKTKNEYNKKERTHMKNFKIRNT